MVEKVILVECRSCHATVTGEALADYEAWVEEEGPPERFTFAKCPKCSSPLLVGQEHYGSQGEREIWSDPYRLYPPRDLVSPRIPGKIRRAHQEAMDCFKAKAFSATAIMCRRTLESACAEHGVKERNLATALQKMKEQGLIESRMLEWAEALRIAGNQAAHGVDESIVFEDARDLLEFTNALLEYLFTFRDKFEEFKKRRDVKPSN